MSKRILIVEDEESIADLEKDYLELTEIQVCKKDWAEILP